MTDEAQYVIGSYWKVRNLKGVYQITDSTTIGRRQKKRRFTLKGIPNTGAIHETTEAFAEDMEPRPKPLDLFTHEEGTFGGELDPYSPGGRDLAARDAQQSADAMPAPDANAPRERLYAAERTTEGPRDASSAAYGDPRGTFAAQPTASPSERQAPRSDKSEATVDELMGQMARAACLKSAALSIYLGYPLRPIERRVLAEYLEMYD